MGSNANSEYFQALERLEKEKSIRVPKGAKINKDSVALEAGRKRGAIKESRPGHAFLIEKINEAAENQEKPKNKTEADVEKHKRLHIKYKRLYEEALGRELMLVRRVESLEEALSEVKRKKL